MLTGGISFVASLSRCVKSASGLEGNVQAVQQGYRSQQLYTGQSFRFDVSHMACSRLCSCLRTALALKLETGVRRQLFGQHNLLQTRVGSGNVCFTLQCCKRLQLCDSRNRAADHGSFHHGRLLGVQHKMYPHLAVYNDTRVSQTDEFSKMLHFHVRNAVVESLTKAVYHKLFEAAGSKKTGRLVCQTVPRSSVAELSKHAFGLGRIRFLLVSKRQGNIALKLR